MVSLLCMHYSFFIKQVHKFKALKQEYREHVSKIKQSSLLYSCLLDTDEMNIIDFEGQNIQEALVHKKSNKRFAWPIERSKFWLSSLFGPRKKPKGFHNGIDMAALKRTPVKAAAAGVVDQVYEDPVGYGKTIVIKHDNTYKTRYAHLDSMLVKVGQSVQAGMLIGRVGDTGNVRKQGRDASHLHFEVYELGKRVNPLYFLS